MTPGRTIEKKGDTGVQNKDEKTAQGGSMTRQQAEQEMEQLRKVFPSVRMLTAEQVQAGEAVGDAARQALEEKTTHSRMEYRGQELYEVTALVAQVDGTPCVLELERYPAKMTKTVSLSSILHDLSYRLLRHGFWFFAEDGSMRFYPMPTPKDLVEIHYDWWKHVE